MKPDFVTNLANIGGLIVKRVGDKAKAIQKAFTPVPQQSTPPDWVTNFDPNEKYQSRDLGNGTVQWYNRAGDPVGAPESVQTANVDTGSSEPMFRLTDKINALNDLYNLIYQDLSTMTKEQRDLIEKGYAQQGQTAQTQYETTARALPLQYGAMGVGDSSYYAKAAGSASDLYNQAIQDIQTQKESKLGELGRAYETQRAALQAGQSQLGGLPQYGTQADVTALESQLGSLAQQRAGLGTQAGYRGALQNIAPAPTSTGAQLETKLQELSSQSIPSFAKQTIAKGYISQSGQDQGYYTDYFDKLLKQQQGGTPTVSPGA
jgi:hypothetical protein